MSERMGPINRRQAIQKLSAPAVASLFHGFHPAVPQQEGEWKPQFFQDSEVETVAAVAERILPETDTPGARRALVHQYIDFILSKGEGADRDRFREGLVSLDGRCAALFGKPFAELEPGRQDEILTGISESQFFQEVKRLTVDGYYRSEVGMRQELGFEGNTFLAEFEGCKHPEHHSWKVGEEPSARAQGERSESRSEKRWGWGPQRTED